MPPAIWIALGLALTGCTPEAAQPSIAAKLPQPPVEVHEHLASSALASLPDVAERAVLAVVNVSSEKVITERVRSPFESDPFFEHFFSPGPDRQRQRHERSLGSGVIVSSDGVILTNNHVIDGATEVLVSLYDNRQLAAEIVGTDPRSDLAVLRLTDPPDDLQPLPFGDSDALRLGEVVLAVGNPFGVGQTVTMGIVSAKGRADIGIVDYEDFIQTDAAINPGNSGGALVTPRGELVGINTAIVSRTGGYQGIGFAIPSNMFQPILDSLLTTGAVERGWLGIGLQALDPKLRQVLDLGEVKGVLVSEVAEDSPAEAAGVVRGDVITHFGGREVDDPARLRNLVAGSAVGSSFEIEVIRDGSKKRIEGKLGSLADSEVAVDGVLDGLHLSTLDGDLRRQHQVPGPVKGLLVREVEPQTPAARAGLRPGDVIMEVNKQPVRSPDQFNEAYAASQDGVLALIWRRGRTLFLVVGK